MKTPKDSLGKILFSFFKSLGVNFLKFTIVFILFIFNIWLINQGSGFTKPREMLFRTYADINRPLIAFPLIYLSILLIFKIILPYFLKIQQKFLTISVFLICLISAFSLSNTVQTNPDYGRYHAQAQYIAQNGAISFLKHWGEFHYQADFPLIPLLFGIGYWAFGKGQATVLITNFFIFSGIICLTYLIGKKLFNQKIALLAILLLSTASYVLTETPAMLVDLGETFFCTLSFYSLLCLAENPSTKKAVTTGLIIFLALLAKIFSFGVLIPFLISSVIWSILKKKRSLTQVLLSWATAILFTSAFIFNKKGVFRQLFLEFFPYQEITWPLLPLLIFTILSFPFVFFLLRKKNLSPPSFRTIPLVLYALLAGSLLYSQTFSFYLKTLFVATNIPLAILYYLSFWLAFKNQSLAAVILIPWALAANFTPNTMFKYQLPSYPAIMLLSAFSLTALFKEVKKQVYALGAIFASSLTTTYFFFLPMINNHVKVNIKEAAEYANHFNHQKITLLFFPIGEYGKEFLKYIKQDSKFATPSLANLLDFYTLGQVKYETTEEFLNHLKNNNLPDILILATHLNHPFYLDKNLEKTINGYFTEGPVFEKANGAGIWRVKLKVYQRK